MTPAVVCRATLSRLHCQPLEVLGEHLQTDIIRHDHLTAHALSRVVGGAGVELGKQVSEPGTTGGQQRQQQSR